MSQPDARAHLLAVAQMLAEISSEMEALGEALCHAPDFAARHMVELQAIDLISQKQRSLASLLEADCPVSAVAQVGLEDVAQRLQRLSANG
ncbi:MAG TPA: hypothetical protein PKD92_06795 [Novosphingobium sp.]|nr:hypothetical protein [Novosphingobium sp.]